MATGRHRPERAQQAWPAAAVALALVLASRAPLLALGDGERDDPWPKIMANEKRARPSSILPYDDMPFDRDPKIQVPCLSSRFCECSASGGWNRTYWLNTASTMFQGQVYVGILQRVTMYRAKITYQQTKQTRRNQVMEVNHLLFCKADLLGRKPRAYDCKLVEPQAEYRERHPFPTHQHFNLVGLIDPRLASAGDDDGLFLQVGCRPKVLADLHEITKFRETPCLVKLLDGRKGGGGGGEEQDRREEGEEQEEGGEQQEGRGARSTTTGEGGATATSHLQRRMLSSHGSGSSSTSRQQLPLPLGSRRLLEGEAASAGGGGAASEAAAAAPAVQLAGGGDKGEAQQQRQAQEQQAEGGGDVDGQERQRRAGESAAQLLSQGMSDVTKEWPLMHLNPIAYTSGEQFPCEKNWVPFEYKGRLLWSRHLSPQEVITVHANGTATTLFRNENDAVFKPLAATCGKGPRGNTPAVRLGKETTGLQRDYYLGILHWTPQRGVVGYDTMERQCHEYLNFFYLMEAEPPFNILEVAKPPIPLVAATNPIYEAWPLRFGMGYISFPTGMVVTQGKVIITYGSGDRNVRVWRASLRDVLLTFSDDVVSQLPAPAAGAGAGAAMAPAG